MNQSRAILLITLRHFNWIEVIHFGALFAPFDAANAFAILQIYCRNNLHITSNKELSQKQAQLPSAFNSVNRTSILFISTLAPCIKMFMLSLSSSLLCL